MIPKDIKTHLLYSTQDGILLQNPLLIKNRYVLKLEILFIKSKIKFQKIILPDTYVVRQKKITTQ